MNDLHTSGAEDSRVLASRLITCPSPPPRTSRCESCRMRPFEVIDSRFGQPAFGICVECYDGAMV
jgi:hypothetical protein